ncbi:MAG TPA: hypothetical protein VF365_10035 [Candidatus Limnocylindria bacterium]
MLLASSTLPGAVRRILARGSIILLLSALAGRLRQAIRGRRGAPKGRRAAERGVLPSLFERHPEASRAPRRAIGLRSVALDRIVGTMRHPSQNTADFLPLPRLRGENWRGRWQRIVRATDRLATLPPIELVQVGDEYYVADGHNRVAAARRAGALEIDADVTQLLVPGVTRPAPLSFDAGSLYGAEEVRQAAGGRLSRTVERRPTGDFLTRRDLVREADEAAEVDRAAEADARTDLDPEGGG